MQIIDISEAKHQLTRIDELFTKEDIVPHIIIGGLAVNQYYNGRDSKDIDLVCDSSVCKLVLQQLYPSNDWEFSDHNQDEYRPDYKITLKGRPGTEVFISFGPKITEREPYQQIKWNELEQNARPFKVQQKELKRILVPPIHALAYTKYLSFLNRTNGKELQDLRDFCDLTNQKNCSFEELYIFLKSMDKPTEFQQMFLEKVHSNQKYLALFETSNISKIAAIFAPRSKSYRNGGTDDLLNRLKINPEEANKEYGVISTIPENKFYELRHKVLEKPSSRIVLVGASLRDAFNRTRSNIDSKVYIGDTIYDKLKDSQNILKSVDIFITDPTLVDEPTDSLSGDSPVRRIEITLKDLAKIAADIDENKALNVYFIPILQLDHIVMTDEHIISRNTLLWTGDLTNLGIDANRIAVKIKGTWLFGEKNDETYSLYNSYERFLKILRQNSTHVPLNVSYSTSVQDYSATKGSQIVNQFRNEIKQLRDHRRIRNISIYKLYNRQLISYVRATWESPFSTSFNELTWKNETSVLTVEKKEDTPDFFSPDAILNDPTQQLLLPFIRKTEELLNEVVKKYDKDGFAKILPSLELGLPNNIQRLAGGFATGSLVLWKCGTPIIPIDTTVNICTSSVYEISSSILDEFGLAFFTDIKLKGLSAGYHSNFEESNHFIIVGQNPATKKTYLILHSSAKEFKYSSVGLYPHGNSWYASKVKTWISKDQDRYLRYIKDEDAVNFVNMTKRIDAYNLETHDWFAETIAGGARDCYKIVQKHHYYMPSSSSVAIGVFLADANELVPVFSNLGREIILIKASTAWTVNLGSKQKMLIPHGWGQEFSSPTSRISVNHDAMKLFLDNNSFEICEKASFQNQNVAEVRNFQSAKAFLERGKNYFRQSEIVMAIEPRYSISRHGFKQH